MNYDNDVDLTSFNPHTDLDTRTAPDWERLCFRTQPTLSFDVTRRLGSSRAYQAG